MGDVILDMGHTRILRLVGGALGSGGLGWFGGSVYQKYLNLKQDQRSHHLPGLPSEASVSVGSLTLGCHPPASIQAEASTAVSPAPSSGVSIPASDTGVPPEPHPSAPRVAQIMRFGFPGLDNIRSHGDYILSYGGTRLLTGCLNTSQLTPAAERRMLTGRGQSSLMTNLFILTFVH